MKKILMLGLLAIVLSALTGCQKSENECRIHGTIPSSYDGKQIFLVPLTNDNRYNVDSVYVKDGKFEFRSDTNMMAKIIMDWRYRYGVQTLLVVVEPGDVNVIIDSISHGSGTPQNDSLEKWKVRTQMHNMQYGKMRQAIGALKELGNEAEVQRMEHSADSFHLAYKNFTRQMAANLKTGVLHDFLGAMFPKTYPKQMPDGKMVTIDADTHEVISQ